MKRALEMEFGCTVKRLVSSPPGAEGGALLRTWISHTVPHMTISITADSIPGIPNWLVAATIGVASIFVLGSTLRGCYAEISAAQRRQLASAAENHEGKFQGSWSVGSMWDFVLLAPELLMPVCGRCGIRRD